MASGMFHADDKDIWDDSMLIESWDEALNEYKKYHSIHAKGSKLEDLEKLKAMQAQGELQDSSMAELEMQGTSHEDRLNETEAEQQTALAENGRRETQTPQAEASLPDNASQMMPGIPPPEAVLGSVGDESLKRLMMSWYYAGYYTGIYVGQQQQKRLQQQQQPQQQDQSQ